MTIMVLDKQKEVLFKLADEIENKDGYTAAHCKRIRDISLKLGVQLGLSDSQLNFLEYGSYLHDLGKVGVDINIIQKPSKLTNEEFAQIKMHTIYGAKMIRELNDSSLETVALMIEQHHERVDGSGYPKQLKEHEILLESQIIAVVDSYDAMTSQRTYNVVKSKSEAIEELIRCIGTHYRKDVVEAFIAIVDEI